jgi:hypothetical protein
MSDDFCIIHGYDHMRSQMGNPIPYCQACEEEYMKTIELDIPADAKTRVRRNVIRTILGELVAHGLNLDQAAESIEHLIKAETDEILSRCHLSNKAEA